MIQTILLFTLRPVVTDEQVEALRAALAAIPFECRRNMRLGRDIGLLDGAMDLAIVTDYDDEDAYRRWFGHPEHARRPRRTARAHHRPPGTLPDPDLSPASALRQACRAPRGMSFTRSRLSQRSAARPRCLKIGLPPDARGPRCVRLSSL